MLSCVGRIRISARVAAGEAVAALDVRASRPLEKSREAVMPGMFLSRGVVLGFLIPGLGEAVLVVIVGSCSMAGADIAC